VTLVADEGVDRPVVERLRQDAHDVVSVAELSPSVADEEVLLQANAQSVSARAWSWPSSSLWRRDAFWHRWR